MNNSKKYLFLIVMILLVVIGVSLAYFGITIIGNDVAKGNKVVTGNLELTFTDTNEISLENAFPGDSFTKTISVKNTGTKEVSYNLVWTELNNEITNNELVIETTCKSLNSSGTEEGTCNSISQKAVSSSNITSNIPIKPEYTHEYTIKVTFIDTGKPQDYNKNKTFEGKLGINESSAKTVYCTFDGKLTQGAEYVNGQYTYRYMQESDGEGWNNITSDGWGVMLTDKTSTDAVTSKLCTYINNKPIVSTQLMFYYSQATQVDLSSFNTSNVINMSAMFAASQASSLDLSSFDTSSVTDMSEMFIESQATVIDITSFNTSKVTNMSRMFGGSMVTSLDFSSFDTSNVTNMNEMINALLLTNLNGIENFNTSNVTDMAGMFAGIKVSSLNLNGFDTSKVTDMSGMFNGLQMEILNLSSFDTSKVTNMSYMFSDATILKTIYVSDKFKTDNVTSSESMFNNSTKLVGGSGTTYDSTKIDKTYARIDGGTSSPGYFTKKPAEPNSFATDSWETIAYAVRTNNLSKYNVGDTKDIDLGTTYGTHPVRIANMSTPSECSTSGFSQTACGFVLEFADIITKHNMNPAGTYKGTIYNYGWNVDGWPASSMYTFVNNDIYNALPIDLKNAIIDTTAVSSYGNNDTANFRSTDKLYLLASKEVYSNASDTASNLTRQLDYYKNLDVTTSNYSGAIKNNGPSAAWWWLRSPSSLYINGFYSVDSNGYLGDPEAINLNGVAPAFRIG